MSHSSRPAILGGEPVRPEGPPDWPLPDPAVEAALRQAWADGNWGRYHGRYAEQLRARLAAFHDVAHVHLCASGTAAVELALRGVGVGPGDEVLLAAYDFKANFQNVLALGAVPVLVDVRADDWQLDVSKLAAALSDRTRAVLVSHLHGGVVDMPGVGDFAQAHRLAVVEDVCQMPGATVFGRRAGTWGDAGVLSFGGSKLTTAGRGGAVLTRRDDVAQRIRIHTQRGNDLSPLSELQAAVLLPQWDGLEVRNAHRAGAVGFLRAALQPYGGLKILPASPLSEPGYYKLGMQYAPADFGGVSRDAFSAAMRAEGIALDGGFRALHKVHPGRRYRSAQPLTEADRADAGILTLHHPVLLGTPADWQQIVTAVEKLLRAAADLARAPACEAGLVS